MEKGNLSDMEGVGGWLSDVERGDLSDVEKEGPF